MKSSRIDSLISQERGQHSYSEETEMRFDARVDRAFAQSLQAARQGESTVQVHVHISVETPGKDTDPTPENQFAERLGEYLRKHLDAGLDLAAMSARLRRPDNQRTFEVVKSKGYYHWEVMLPPFISKAGTTFHGYSMTLCGRKRLNPLIDFYAKDKADITCDMCKRLSEQNIEDIIDKEFARRRVTRIPNETAD